MSFTFKQFHIDDSQCAMKVGTDSILLGALADISAVKRVLDIGCGSGLLCLMLAQKMADKSPQTVTQQQIVGVELDVAATEQAKQNVAASPWPSDIEVINDDINQFDQPPFDLIISNPPYFVDSLLGPDESRNQARHSQSLTAQQLLIRVAQLLTQNGQFYLILPTKEAQALMDIGEQYGLFLQQMWQIHTVKGKGVSRVVMSFVKSQQNTVNSYVIDIYDENKQYSSQFIALTGMFYLNR